MTDNYKLYRKKWLELTRGGMSPEQADVTAQEFTEELEEEYVDECTQNYMELYKSKYG